MFSYFTISVKKIKQAYELPQPSLHTTVVTMLSQPPRPRCAIRKLFFVTKADGQPLP